MLPFSLLCFLLACVGAAVAAVTPTNTDADFASLKVGSPFRIRWSGAEGNVTISLLSSTGTAIETIGSSLPGESFLWTPPALPTTDSYVFQFVDSTQEATNSVAFTVLDATSTPPAASGSQISNITASPTINVTSASLSADRNFTFTPSSAATASPTATASSKSKKLSPAAIVAISLGCAAFIMLMFALTFVVCWRSAAQKSVDDSNGIRKVSDAENSRNVSTGPSWEAGIFDPGSTGSKNNLLTTELDGSTRMGTMMTDGRTSRLDTATLSDGRDSRTDNDGRGSRMESDGRVSRLSVLSDGRTSRIGRFEFEESPTARGFSGGIRIVQMDNLKLSDPRCVDDHDS